MLELSITSYPLAMKDYFSLNGKTIAEFMTELKALSDTEKYEFRAMLKEVGYKLP